MTSDLWALAATLILAMVQIGMQSVATLIQAGPAWVAGSPGLRSVFWQGGQIGILVILLDIFN